MSPAFPWILLGSGLLAATLPFFPGVGGGWKRTRVIVHLLSIAGFAVAGALFAGAGERLAGIGVMGIAFTWAGAFWLLSIHRRLRRQAHLHEERGIPSGEVAIDDLVASEEMDSQERELLRRLLAMRQIRVSQIATPREEIVYADCAGGTAEALAKMESSRHPRVPVVDGSLDRIMGILHAKDLVSFVLEGRKSPALKGVMRRPLFVSRDRTVASLLELFRSQRSHMAVLVDSYSRTAGLITRTDLFRHLSGGDRGGEDA